MEVNLPQDAADILTQVKGEIKISQDFVSSKRETFRERIKLYNNQRKQKDKIGDTSLYNVMTTLMAVYYTDELEAKFEGRDVADAALANNLDKLAKFDHEEMEMDTINYLTQWDRFFFGVGIRWVSGWDKKRKTPLPKSIDTLSWLPDPAGYLMLKNFRFMGFENQYTKSEMTKDAGFFNTELLISAKSEQGDEASQNRSFYREAQGLDDPAPENMVNDGSNLFDMIDWLTVIVGEDGVQRKYLITVDTKVQELYRCEELEQVTAEEKEDPMLVPFPVSLNYYSPTRNDPFGVSVCDLVEDKQRAKSILKNLKIASRKADLYPMYMYNRDKILNRRDLDFAFNKFIAVRGDVGDNVVVPLNKVPSKQGEVENDMLSLDRDIEIATGADKVSQGVMSDNQRTLGEVQQTMANASMRFLLGTRINNFGEKRFWKLWYRSYKQNFAAGEKKTVRLRSALDNQFFTFIRKDFITVEDPDIRIVSRIETEKQRMKDQIAFGAIVPLINSDPTKPLASKRYTERHLLKLHNLPEELINIMSPKTPDEMRAEQENELLSRNQSVKVDIQREEHLSHIIIHSQCDDTDARNAHIQLHREAYIQSGQMEKDQMLREMIGMRGENNGAVNQAQNTFANQNSNIANKETGGVSNNTPSA